MIRRAMLAAVAWVIAGSWARAQPAARGSPSGREVFDAQRLVSRALSIATEVDREAENYLRQAVRNGWERLHPPEGSLDEIRLEQVPSLLVSQHNLPELLFEVLRSSKRDGAIIVTVETVRGALGRLCPLYPFC